MEQRKELPAEVPVEQKIERPMIGRPLDRRPRRRTDGTAHHRAPGPVASTEEAGPGRAGGSDLPAARPEAVPDHHEGRGRGHPFRRLKLVKSDVWEKRKPPVAAK